jgi:hypothetical protein
MTPIVAASSTLRELGRPSGGGDSAGEQEERDQGHEQR